MVGTAAKKGRRALRSEGVSWCGRPQPDRGQVPQGGRYKFRKLGFIEYNGTLMVNSSLLSAVLRE